MDRIWIFIIALLVVGLTMMPTREPYREMFGLAGYTRPTSPKLDDPAVDKAGYEKVENVAMTSDLMQELVLKTNAAIAKRTNLNTYIIQTSSVDQYKAPNGESLYECMFVVASISGFSYGFTVVSALSVSGGKANVVSIRTQPLDSQAPTNIKPYASTGDAKDFLDYRVVQQITPTEPQLVEAAAELRRIEAGEKEE
tara:strand:- start:665 stop:1255 length:591 start_codon:yes stop_codon:yes gene_type:complete